MDIDVFTLFPEAFDWFESQRHVRNALAAGHRFGTVNYRDTTTLSGNVVDDTPFGGGAGMVLRVDVVEWALRARYGVDPAELASAAHLGPRDAVMSPPESETGPAGPARRVIALTPGGRILDDTLVDELVAEPALTLLCGRYEGFDERILDHFCSDRVSIGRYVLAGGELAAMVLADAVIRKLPGSLGHEESALEESYSAALDGAPEYPHYTRPAEHRGWKVPDILLSGHHANIRRWRLEQSRLRAADPAHGGAPAPVDPAPGHGPRSTESDPLS